MYVSENYNYSYGLAYAKFNTNCYVYMYMYMGLLITKPINLWFTSVLHVCTTAHVHVHVHVHVPLGKLTRAFETFHNVHVHVSFTRKSQKS